MTIAPNYPAKGLIQHFGAGITPPTGWGKSGDKVLKAANPTLPLANAKLDYVERRVKCAPFAIDPNTTYRPNQRVHAAMSNNDIVVVDMRNIAAATYQAQLHYSLDGGETWSSTTTTTQDSTTILNDVLVLGLYRYNNNLFIPYSSYSQSKGMNCWVINLTNGALSTLNYDTALNTRFFASAKIGNYYFYADAAGGLYCASSPAVFPAKISTLNGNAFTVKRGLYSTFSSLAANASATAFYFDLQRVMTYQNGSYFVQIDGNGWLVCANPLTDKWVSDDPPDYSSDYWIEGGTVDGQNAGEYYPSSPFPIMAGGGAAKRASDSTPRLIDALWGQYTKDYGIIIREYTNLGEYGKYVVIPTITPLNATMTPYMYIGD